MMWVALLGYSILNFALARCRPLTGEVEKSSVSSRSREKAHLTNDWMRITADYPGNSGQIH
jgi:hypothetical protein